MVHLGCWPILTACLGFHSVLALPQDNSEISRTPVLNSKEFFYQVLISEYDEGPMCGGVLVDKGYVVTSATCVWKFGGIKKFLEKVVLYGGGSVLLYDLGDVTDAVVNPQYLSNPHSHDLAVLKYDPDEKEPKLKYANLNDTWNELETCILTSWWVESQTWPGGLVWSEVSPVQCSDPSSDSGVFCFKDDSVKILKEDFGSPVVCNGILRGLIPEDSRNQAINITANYNWIVETIAKLKSEDTTKPTTSDDTKPLLLKILQKLNLLAEESNSDESEDIDSRLSKLNKQVVIPLSYVMFAMVIFFFVLLFFIVLFTIVLVYYSRK